VQSVVVVDTRERESRLLAALQRLGVPTELRRLAVGDYIAGFAVVERKSVRDLHLSVINGRFWPQIGRLSRAKRHPYLLVEGQDLDAGPLRPTSVRGAILAVGELGVRVIRSADPDDSALWLEVLARRDRAGQRGPRVYARRVATPAEAMLAAVPGISAVSARALLARFGSVAAVLAADPEEWLSTRGIGPRRAQAILETLARSDAIPSRPPRGRPDPST
jgi:DNA excision repair protein ERCC-4